MMKVQFAEEMGTQKPNKRRRDSANANDPPTESRAAEAVTVAWMMSALAACLGTVLATGFYAWLLFTVERGKIDAKMVMIPFLFFFIASVTGAICLILTAFALKMRRTKPPLAVTIFAVFFGAAPLVAAVALAVVYGGQS